MTRILDPELAPAGHARIVWARRHMPVCRLLAGDLAASGEVRGLKIGLSMVLEPKTAVLALLLAEAGAVVSVYAHTDETDDDVAAALADAGLEVFARSTAGPIEQKALALDFLRGGLEVLLDDGSSLIRLAHLEAPEVFETLVGAAEETTSGLRPLRVMEAQGVLRMPVIAVNDAPAKTLFDNLYGTGQSTVFAIADLLDDAGIAPTLAGLDVVVAGFGHVGQGVAAHAAALGAIVTVSEVDPLAALQASFAGFAVSPLLDAVAGADVVISATGIARTIDLDILHACREGAAVAVAGGVPHEISLDEALADGAVRHQLGRKVESLVFPDGRSVVVLDDGGCINITAGEGNPIEIMDLSFGVQLAALAELAERVVRGGERGTLAPGVHALPASVDARVARAALAAAGTAMDSASAAQTEFVESWHPTRFDLPEETA